jgi:hypothetical protein
MNVSLEVDIIEEEILSTLSSLKKGKISGLDGLTIEFYLGFYDILKEDILKVVQESK